MPRIIGTHFERISVVIQRDEKLENKMEMFRHESAIHLVKIEYRGGISRCSFERWREASSRKFTVIFISGTFIGALQFSYRTR